MSPSEQKKIDTDARALAQAFAEKYSQGKDKDIGTVYAGIWDIYDSTVALYGDVLPRIASMAEPTPDDLLEELVDVYLEFKHIYDHAGSALRALCRIEKSCRRLPKPRTLARLGQRTARDDELAAQA